MKAEDLHLLEKSGIKKIDDILLKYDQEKNIKEIQAKKQSLSRKEQKIKEIQSSPLEYFYIKPNSILSLLDSQKPGTLSSVVINEEVIVQLHVLPDQEEFYYSETQTKQPFKIHKSYLTPLNRVMDLNNLKQSQISATNPQKIFIITEQASLLSLSKAQIEAHFISPSYYRQQLDLNGNTAQSLHLTYMHFLKGNLPLEAGIKISGVYGKTLAVQAETYSWSGLHLGPSLNFPLSTINKQMIKINLNATYSLFHQVQGPRPEQTWDLDVLAFEIGILMNDSTVPQGNYWGFSLKKEWPSPQQKTSLVPHEFDRQKQNTSLGFFWGWRWGKYL